jgi:TRAP-type C4-dicarboxylate transport system permease small subunit
MFIVETLVKIAIVYAAIGMVFAAVFVFAGAGRIDGAAKGAPLGFRLLILPGSAALWPLLLLRWLRGEQPPAERNPHRDRAGRGSR